MSRLSAPTIALTLLMVCGFNALSWALPVGVNLSPLGGGFQAVNWNPVSTYAFADLFKHCGAFYIRSTMDGATNNIGWQPNTAVPWLPTGYPASLPYTDSRNFYLAMCDIGVGGTFIRNGHYKITWTGTGEVGFSSSSASVISSSANSKVVQLTVTGTAGLNVRLLRSSAADPVTNINIVPVEIADTFQTTVFHPDFLKLFQGFDHIRFTQWAKLTNGQSKTWAARTTPASQSQQGSDGVAIEHMTDLIRVTGVSSAWFSFPLASADYNSKALALIASTLPTDRPFKLYFEAGSPESHNDNDRSAESLTLFATAQTIFANYPNIELMPSAAVANVAYIPYLINWFATSFSKLKAIGVTAQFGRSATPNDHYNSYGQWDNYYADYTVAQIIKEVRSSSLVADTMLNNMLQKLYSKGTNFELVGYVGGPYFSAPTYMYRSAKDVVTNCANRNQFPCSWGNTKTYAANLAEYNTILPAMIANATKEQQVEDLLLAAQRSSDIYEIYLDFLRRWETLGGGLIISSPIVRIANRCLTGGTACGIDTMFESPFDFNFCTGSPASSRVDRTINAVATPCQKFWPLLDYKAGLRSKLPYTAGDVTVIPEPTCSAGCQWGTCSKGACRCFAGYSGVDCSVLSSKPNRPNDCTEDTGINLAGIADWSSEQPFVDLFVTSRAWISQDHIGSAWNTNTRQYLRKDGYPSQLTIGQRLGTMMIRDLRGHSKTGNYIVLYDGDGVISFGMDVSFVKRDVGRIEITVAPSTGLNNGIFLTIDRTNPLDPIRNIRVITPGYEQSYKSSPFHPVFLDKIKMFKTIRFMDWANTNGVQRGEWADRTILNVNTRSFSNSAEVNGVAGGGGGFGVSIEQMILLCNIVGADAWFNMPHLATDEYVRNFAQLVKTTLRPDVKVHIEYSNEVWGTQFAGGQYAQTQGIKLGLSTNSVTARFCYNILRSNQIFSIWSSVFAESAVSRLEFIINSQSVNPDVTRQYMACSSLLASIPAYASQPLIHTAYAIAPYFGTYTYSKDKNLKVFLNTTLPAQVASLTSNIAGHFALTSPKGLKLLTYESGQGLKGSGTTDNLAILANRDSGMTKIYKDYYNMLRANGVKLMMAFTSASLPDNSQTWGTWESTDQDPLTAPKYQGLVQYIKDHAVCSYDSAKSLPLSSSDSVFTCQSDCSSSGVCVGQDTCECFYGFQGRFCESSKYTEHTDMCGYKCTFDQGKCVPDYVLGGTDRYWKCECFAPYYGPQCSLFDCKNNCNYNGKCLDADICHCFPGYRGNLCEIDCGCAGHGVCSTVSDSAAAGGAPTCLCDVGYIWSYESKTCVPACNNHGTSDVLKLSTTTTVAPAASAATTCAGPNQAQPAASDCQHGTFFNGECECWAGYIGTNCDQSAPRPNQDSVVGMNLGGLSYWGTELTFVDLFKTSSEWVSVWLPGWTLVNPYVWGNGQSIHLREDGYPSMLEPGQILVKLIQRNVRKHTLAGKYVCLFDGEGEIDFGFDAVVNTIGKNRIEFTFSPTEIPGCTAAYCNDNGIYLRLLATNPLNPVRNIRVVMAAFEHSHVQHPFYPPFLQSIKRYSVIRFKDWQHTDSSIEKNWADRPLVSDVSQTAQQGGVALEHIIDLCNRLAINPWFGIPHAATDDYVREFAKLVKERLRPDLSVYLEYSNEVWNTLFSQGTYAQQQGLALGLATDKTLAGYRFYAQRSSQIFQAWKSTNTVHSLVRVVSTFSLSTSASESILSWFKQSGGEAEVLGVAGYFDCGGLGNANKVATTAVMTVDQVLEACSNDLPNVVNTLKNQKAVAVKYGLALQTYEAGQSLVEYNVMAYGNGETPGLTDLFLAVNRHSGMGAVYKQYIDAFIQNDVIAKSRPFMSFSSTGLFTKYGSWGIKEFTHQLIEQTPKYAALRTYFAYDIASMASSVPSVTADANTCVVCAATACANNALSFSDDYSYVGAPFITSPRKGDVWRNGQTQSIEWLVPADGVTAIAAFTVSVKLWKNAYCGYQGANSQTFGGQIVQDITASTTFSSGKLLFALNVVDESLLSAGSNSFFIEVRGDNSHSYFSEVFTVVATSSQSAIVGIDVAWTCDTTPATALVNSCTVNQDNGHSSALLNHNSVWNLAPTVPNQVCNQEYPQWPILTTSSWKLSSCYTTAASCRLIRTQGNGKPITDCVANLSPYPALNGLSPSTTVALATPQAKVDYVNWLALVGYFPVSLSGAQCSAYSINAADFVANTCPVAAARHYLRG